MQTPKAKLVQWFAHYGQTRQAHVWLSAISFTESSFFPIPPDPFLIAMLLIKENTWWKLALNVTISSVLGGLFGYYIGYLFFDTIGLKLISAYQLENEFQDVVQLFENYGFMTIFTAAFTPIPYKIFTLASGFSHVSLPMFIVASVLGRSIRFFFVAGIMKMFGERIGKIIFTYFNILCVVAVVAVVLIIFLHFKN